MPTNRTTYGSQISCARCSTSVETYDVTPSQGSATVNGRPVSDTFGWDGYAGGRDEYGQRRGRFHSYCRECQRAARRATVGARVPGTSRATRSRTNRRAFGVEIECMLSYYTARPLITQAISEGRIARGWKVVTDGSVYNGCEVVSPKLKGDRGRSDVKVVCEILRDAGATINRSCGLHVHHDMADIDLDAFKRIVRYWHNAQPMMDALVAPSRRNGANTYCRPLDANDLYRVEQATSLQSIRGLYRNHYQSDRYRTLNYSQYGRRGTVEARQHQGTLDAEKIIAWVDLGQAIIESAKSAAVAPQPFTRMREFLASLTTMPEQAGTFLLGRAAHFGTTEV